MMRYIYKYIWISRRNYYYIIDKNMPIPRRIFDTRIIGGLLQIPKAMIQNKREGEGAKNPVPRI